MNSIKGPGPSWEDCDENTCWTGPAVYSSICNGATASALVTLFHCETCEEACDCTDDPAEAHADVFSVAREDCDAKGSHKKVWVGETK